MTPLVKGLILKTCQLVKLCAFDAKMQKKEKWLNWHLSNTLNKLRKKVNTSVISLHLFCLYSVHDKLKGFNQCH